MIGKTQLLQKDFIKLNKAIKKLENIFSNQLSKLHVSETSIFKIINVWLIHMFTIFKWKIIDKAKTRKENIVYRI